ncbi:MAG: DUF3995 domain-containing protein [Actinomycetota bacterium]
MMDTTIAAAGLVLLAVAHSVLGETGVIRPLLAAEWTIADIPRWAADRLLRGAWHLTSLAWLGLAAITLDVAPLTTVGVVALASAALMFVVIRPHFAWPVFLLSGLGALRADGALPEGAVRAGAGVTVVALGLIGLLHLYWAGGGRWGHAAAVPVSPDGGPAFEPGPLLTAGVAVALFAFAALVAAPLAGLEHGLITVAVAVGVFVLAVRAIGDGRQAGFSKSDRSSDFAVADDRVFTPLVVLLAFGAAGSLLV